MEQSYKEKYEQAIERLKQWDREHPCAGYVLSDRDKFIFPELAESESEDEKIRKRLITDFGTIGKKEWGGLEVKDILAWLEKQAERKTPQWMIDFLDNYRRKIGCSLDHDEARDVEGKILCIMQWLENQCQVKESTISQHENRTCEENGNSLTYEDEKVRKALIDFFGKGAKYGGQTNGVYDKDILAWLERQGEHANFRNKIQVGDKVTRNEAGVLVNLSQLKRVAKPSEKQGEQKFEMKTAEESLGIDSDTYNKIVDECIFGEQKPADKVEPKFKVGEKELTEEELREGLIRGMINEHNRVVKEVLRTEYEKGRADAIAEMQKEWSEEDSFRMETLISVIKSGGNIRPELRNEFVNWLKSLRPQNRWKPSELQLGCLSDAIEHYNSLGYPAPKLKELLDDLKKIKEGKV